MPLRFLRAIEPIVAHGLREMSVEGASLEHTLRQVTLMGTLVGSGLSPRQAIREVEYLEAQLLRWHPGEMVEPYHWGRSKGWGMRPFSMEQSMLAAEDARRGMMPAGPAAGPEPTAAPVDIGGPSMAPFEPIEPTAPFAKGGQPPFDFSAQAMLSGKGQLSVSTPSAGKGMQPSGKGMQPTGKGMQPTGKGMQPTGKGMQPTGKGMQPSGKGMQPSGKGMQPFGKGMQSMGKGMQPMGKGMQPFGKGMGMKGVGPMPFTQSTSAFGTGFSFLPQGKGTSTEG